MKIALMILIFSVVYVSVTLPSSTNTDGFQQLKVPGKVIDSQTGSAMPGVNVLVKDVTIGSITDAN
jgi:hypothetical protein